MWKKILVGAIFYMSFVLTVSADEKLEIDNVLVEKGSRQMYLRQGEKVLKSYKIALGGQPEGAKEREGDQKTPEGSYYIQAHNPHSSYHLSLRISYPNTAQKELAQKMNYSTGGDIMIHGYPNYVPDILFDFVHKNYDWTAGCIAVTDREIEEIYELVKDGTPILIRP